MRELLRQLNTEFFVFDTHEKLIELPRMDGYKGHLINSNSFEVEIEKHQSLNALFANLTAQDIQILSMKNKTNRLEELFISLVQPHEEKTEEVSG